VNIGFFPSTTPAPGTYVLGLGFTVIAVLILWRHYRHTPRSLFELNAMDVNIIHSKSIEANRKPLSLPELYQPVKAMLVLRSGTDVWLPYMIPLYTTITTLGSALPRLSTNDEVGFELLSSLSIDEEHCLIRAQNEAFMIFDLARFNNTLVDQAPVPPEGRLLSTGAIITLGAVEYIFVHNRSN